MSRMYVHVFDVGIMMIMINMMMMNSISREFEKDEILILRRSAGISNIVVLVEEKIESQKRRGGRKARQDISGNGRMEYDDCCGCCSSSLLA
jgi:hypothetical protein